MFAYQHEQLSNSIISMGGIVGFLLSKRGSPSPSSQYVTDPKLSKDDQRVETYERVIDLLKTTNEESVEIRLGDTKILAYKWDYYYFVIEAVVHHAVNKSLRRSVRRLRKKYDKGVQSKPWKPPSQPAVSSSDRAESSPSPAGATPSTGVSPAGASSPASPSSTPPHENSERKPASPWDPKPA